MKFVQSATRTLLNIHRFATERIKPLKRFFHSKSETMKLFDLIQGCKKDRASLRAIQQLLLNHGLSPSWTPSHQKEQQLVLYIEYLLTQDTGFKVVVKKDLLKILNLDHELSRKIAKDLV